MNKIKIGVIGVEGAYGSFLGRVLSQKGYEVIGSDIGTITLNRDVVKWADTIFFCVPLLQAEEIIRDMVPYSRQDQLWVDVSSVKEGPINAMRESRAEVIGIHGLSAPPSCGVTLNGQTVMVWKSRVKHWGKWFDTFMAKLEAKTVVVEPKTHDDVMLICQNFIHLTAIIFPKVVSILGVDPKYLLSLTTPPARMFYRIAARVLSNKNPYLYANIQIGNPRSLVLIDAMIKSLQRIRGEVAARNLEGCVVEIEEAKASIGEKFLLEVSEEEKRSCP